MAINENKLQEALKNVKTEVSLTVSDLYGKEVYFTLDSDEADEEHESWFYFCVENKDDTLEIEFTKEDGIEILKSMAKALGAKKLKIEVEF